MRLFVSAWYISSRMGRDMDYDCWSCDLLCAASSPDLYRINLEQVRPEEITVVFLFCAVVTVLVDDNLVFLFRGVFFLP